MAQVLRRLSLPSSSRALVGHATRDDAAVYRLSPELALVETVDFFPPVVDDPTRFGEIAAANALSDVWAMGAKPLFALNLVAFPKTLPLSILSAILAGGAKKAKEAGIPILGGHSIQDAEPKYGLAVTGVVHPARVLRNSTSRAGDVLVLTKPLGSGIAATAMKRKVCPPALERRAIRLMAELNRRAGERFAALRVHALTDVTGFGLLGHLLEMMEGAKLRARVRFRDVPVLPDVLTLAREGVVPQGTVANLDFVQRKVRFPRGLAVAERLVLADAQTNGGLLAAVPRGEVGPLLDELRRAKVLARVIGEVGRGAPGVDVE